MGHQPGSYLAQGGLLCGDLGCSEVCDMDSSRKSRMTLEVKPFKP